MTVTILVTIAIVAGMGGTLILLPRMARPTVPFGVRVPDDRTDARAVASATAQYRRGVVLAMVVVAAVLVAVTPLLPEPVVLTAAAVVPFLAWLAPYGAARRTVRAAKRDEGWYEGVRRTASAETSLRTAPPRFPWPWAVPAVLLALGTALIGVLVYPSLPDRVATHIGSSGPDRFAETTVSSAFGIVAVQILLTVLLLGLVAATLRSTHELSPAAPRTSAEQHRRFLSSMARSVLLLVTGLNITMLVVALMLWDVIAPTAAWQVASIAPSLLAAMGVVVVAIRAGQSGHRLAADVEEESAGPPRAHPDDDANWIGGLLYVNRDDPALLVPKRFGGVGWTVNLGRPAAWLVIAALLAAGIGLPVWAASGAA